MLEVADAVRNLAAADAIASQLGAAETVEVQVDAMTRHTADAGVSRAVVAALCGSAATTAPPGPARMVIAAFWPVRRRKPPTAHPGPATNDRTRPE